MHEKTISRYNQMTTNIFKMIPSSELLSRSSKRHGWIPFLGTILHTVTGVAKQADLDRLRNVVKKISDTRVQQFQAFEKMTEKFESISGATNKRISSIIKIQKCK
jgi:hypothetical protein